MSTVALWASVIIVDVRSGSRVTCVNHIKYSFLLTSCLLCWCESQQCWILAFQLNLLTTFWEQMELIVCTCAVFCGSSSLTFSFPPIETTLKTLLQTVSVCFSIWATCIFCFHWSYCKETVSLLHGPPLLDFCPFFRKFLSVSFTSSLHSETQQQRSQCLGWSW